uniref:uncharacterized protein isoform X2 n=1 Tax=Pristiophorus japonicus TaxID=55135 RepID=UPI00398EB0EA
MEDTENAAQDQTDVKSVEATAPSTSSIANSCSDVWQQENVDVKGSASRQTKKNKRCKVKNRSSRRRRKSCVKKGAKQKMDSPNSKQLNGSKKKGTTESSKGSTDESGSNSVTDNSITHKAEPDDVASSPSEKQSAEKARSDTRSKQRKRDAKIKQEWGELAPYLDTSTLNKSLAEPSVISYDYKSRLTANTIVEPYISYKMDHMLPDLLTRQLENWNKKKGKLHSDKRISLPFRAQKKYPSISSPRKTKETA